MAYAKKRVVASSAVTQETVAMEASKALASRRSTKVQLLVRLVFTSACLMNRWESKSLQEMLGSFSGHKQPRAKKDLTLDYESSWYRNDRGELAMPCRILKACLVRGAINLDDKQLITGADIKRSVRVLGYTTPIHLVGQKEMDIKIVKNHGSPDIRARALIQAGSWMETVLQFPPSFGTDRVMAALEEGGDTAGLCEMRPEKGGELGTFRVEVNPKTTVKDIQRVLKECSVPEEPFTIPQHMLRAIGAMANEELTDKGRKAKALLEHVNGQSRRSRSSVATEA